MSEFWSGAGTAAISGGLGVLGSGLNYLFNKKLAAQQNQYNIDMWKMQAEYNSPQAQMQRFSAAGLNPNLIYGLGNNGNMATAPQMVVPNAPELSKHLEKIGEAFNIENLKTIIAKRKEAEADALQATVEAHNAKDLREARKDFGNLYDFDVSTGKFIPIGEDEYVTRALPPHLKKLADITGAHSNRLYFFRNLQADYYKNLHLVPYRASYLDSQVNLNAPQIKMRDYDWKYYPKTFWIDRAKTAAPLTIPASIYHYIHEYKRTGKNPFYF